MRAWAFAARSLVRQPARTGLGVTGVAAVGALLFDMLLLSRGLVVSTRALLDGSGFDVRVVAADTLPLSGPPITKARATVRALALLPEVETVVPIRFAQANATGKDGRPLVIALLGAGGGGRLPWFLVAGSELGASGATPPGLIVNRRLASALALAPGAEVGLHEACDREGSATPAARFRVSGIADFPFEDAGQSTAAMRLEDLQRFCEDDGRDEADILLVASREGMGPDRVVQAIHRLRPDLHPYSNEELVARFQQAGFSYFRQISTVLAAVTLFFGFLLISVLLTVSVNQRFAEIAALRALGFSRQRVVVDVLCQSALLVGTGGLLALPLGLGLAQWLDRILRALPDIPARLHFFVFEPRALVLHVSLMVLTAVLAAAYPMRMVARLPIAATLRDEVVS